MRDVLLFLLLIPRNIGVLVLRGYRAVISPLYGDVCRYHPSCSAYGLGSVQQQGLIAGSALTAWRIVRCNPWSAGGIDDVRAARHDRYRVTPFGWVVPASWAAASAAPSAVHPHHLPAAGTGEPELVSSSPVSRKD
jgi:putative membrane protein insertion efficiency factor